MNNLIGSTLEIGSITGHTRVMEEMRTMNDPMDNGEAENYASDVICLDMK